MATHWSITEPTVRDVGDEGEVVGRLDVSMIAGSIDIVAHDEPTARVEITDVVGHAVEVEWTGERLRIRHHPGTSDLGDLWEKDGANRLESFLTGLKAQFSGIERNSARISVLVPRGARIDVGSVSGRVLVGGIEGGVRARTVSGGLTLADVVGAIAARTVSGTLEAQRLRGHLDVNSVSGSFTAQACALDNVAVKTVSGDVTLDLSGPACTIAAKSVSGDVTIRAPYAGLDVDARTTSGQVVVGGRSFPQGYGPGQKVSLREGDGGLVLHAKAVSGSITLLHAGPQDAPADRGPQDALPGNVTTPGNANPQDTTSSWDGDR